MNVSYCRAIKTTPYALVFGQDPHRYFSLLEELKHQGFENEEDLPESFTNALEEKAKETLVNKQEDNSYNQVQEQEDDVDNQVEQDIDTQTQAEQNVITQIQVERDINTQTQVEPDVDIQIDTSNKENQSDINEVIITSLLFYKIQFLIYFFYRIHLKK
jgi:uncharacterized protein (DUF342 family)